MATSEAQIVNLALAKLGIDKFINNLNDKTDEARIASTIYADVRDAVLRDGAWKFAIKRVELAPTVDVVPFANGMKPFTPPPDMILAIGSETHDVRWMREGAFILADTSVFRLRYVARIEDVNQYDSLFVQCLADRLAYEMSYAITQNFDVQKVRLQIYEQSIALARHRGSIEQATDYVVSDLYDRARYGNYYPIVV